MDREAILAKLNKPQAAYLATISDGEPRVRGIQLYAVDGRGLMFQTGTMKEMYRELKACPKAELCVVDPETHEQFRIRGEFEVADDLQLKREIADHPSRVYLRPWREAIGDQAFFEKLIVFRMRKATVQIWTMATNLSPMPSMDLLPIDVTAAA
jgi:pyridoxamine 5'-phosphate oxidase